MKVVNHITLTLCIVFLLIACKSENKDTQTTIVESDSLLTKIRQSESVLPENIKNIVQLYSEAYPITEITDSGLYTFQSYLVYVGELNNKQSLVISRQPFVFEFSPNVILNITKDIDWKVQGFLKMRNIPLVFYGDSTLIADVLNIKYQKQIPKVYYIDESKSYSPIITPSWSYELISDSFSLINRGDTIFLE